MTKNKKRKNICLEECSALCCKYFAMDITKPRTKWDINDLKWKLKHKNIHVYIINKRWCLLITSDCMYLQDDNKCGIYETRPDICRKYSHVNCEKTGPWYDVFISSPEELDKHLEKEKVDRKKKN
ncbi:MAG: YkgJ family cysteine cluster protein [Candidatus Omnitrophota bacterium]